MSHTFNAYIRILHFVLTAHPSHCTLGKICSYGHNWKSNRNNQTRAKSVIQIFVVKQELPPPPIKDCTYLDLH